LATRSPRPAARLSSRSAPGAPPSMAGPMPFPLDADPARKVRLAARAPGTRSATHEPAAATLATGRHAGRLAPRRGRRPRKAHQRPRFSDTTRWLVVADEGVARIYEKPRTGGDLENVAELMDEEAHAHRAALRRDAYGRRGGAERSGSSVTSAPARAAYGERWPRVHAVEDPRAPDRSSRSQTSPIFGSYPQS